MLKKKLQVVCFSIVWGGGGGGEGGKAGEVVYVPGVCAKAPKVQTCPKTFAHNISSVSVAIKR